MLIKTNPRRRVVEPTWQETNTQAVNVEVKTFPRRMGATGKVLAVLCHYVRGDNFTVKLGLIPPADAFDLGSVACAYVRDNGRTAGYQEALSYFPGLQRERYSA